MKHIAALRGLVAGGLLLLFWPGEVQAYIDPGTGSYLFQLLIAGFLGILFLLKSYWKKSWGIIEGKFLKKQKKSADE
jgi:hypothetical protein